MADTITLTFPTRFPKRLGGSGNVGLIAGTASLTSYDTSKTELTALTGLFRTMYSVVAGGVSSNGYAMRWDATAKAFRAYDTGAASGNALAEAVASTNVGTFPFIAMGMVERG